KHPDSLVEGHINQLCARAVAKNIDLFKILRAACVNPVEHYKLKVGLLRINDFVDFIVIRDLKTFKVEQTYINGKLVAEQGKSLIQSVPPSDRPAAVNNFHCRKKVKADFRLEAGNSNNLPVIEALNGQLITNKL